MIHVVLCGGAGERLWPLSHEWLPKQFLKLFDERSLFQRVVLGNRKFCHDCIVICHAHHQSIVLQQLSEIKITPLKIILESVSRNTAAAISLGALSVDPSKELWITPADHYVDYDENYANGIKAAKEAIDRELIVLFGIRPNFPATGYGYIEMENGKVKHFHEKPNLETAQEYLKSGFYWNSGMLGSRASTLLQEIEVHSLSTLTHVKKAFDEAIAIESSIQLIPEKAMGEIPSISFDCAVLEKSELLALIPVSFKWEDIGSFDSLYAHLPKDAQDNADLNATPFFYHSHRNLAVGSNKKKIIATVNMEDCVIIDTEDVLLIAKRGSTQAVKEALHKLIEGN